MYDCASCCSRVALLGDMAVLAREGGSLKVTLHQLPSTSASPLTSLAPARPVPLREQQGDVYFFSQASTLYQPHAA